MPSHRREGPSAGLARSLRRLDQRVRLWPNSRWEGRGSDGRSHAEAAYELAVTLAALGRQAGNGAPDGPPPQVQLHAVADQLAVLGHELEGAPQAATYAQAAVAAVERFLSSL